MSDSTPDACCQEYLLDDPDCCRCLQRKLRATAVVTFFEDAGDWRISNYQGDKPSEAAEVEMEMLLRSGVATQVASHGEPSTFLDPKKIKKFFGPAAGILHGKSVIAAPVALGNLKGVRVAWRSKEDPFSDQEVALISCSGACPPGCMPKG